jgi:hypothetical protein
MKFTIQSLEQQTIQTKYGAKQKFRFTSNGQTYDAWAKKGYTDQFNIGYSFEAELSGKPYKGIDTVQWPKADSYSNQSSTGANVQISTQLDRIEQKLDQLVRMFTGTNNANWTSTTTLTAPNIPFAGSPHPSDEDAPF